MNSEYRHSEEGSIVLSFVCVFSLIALLSLQYLMGMDMIGRRAQVTSNIQEGKAYLLEQLYDLVSNDFALKNSRFAINAILSDCLKAPADRTYGCDETQIYNLVTFAPTPIMAFDGSWPTAPASLPLLTGAKEADSTGLTPVYVFYTSSGGRCAANLTNENNLCPLRAYTQFTPLCDGTLASPAVSGAPGPCLGPANGFKIFLGIVSNITGVAHLSDYGLKRKEFIVSAQVFFN
ncbi:MAG TPA: hypothetical protein VJB59_11485 [Bdellovibrionota bacterium]|nr:hypothetical protein [Bdellovibrionota bacterium]